MKSKWSDEVQNFVKIEIYAIKQLEFCENDNSPTLPEKIGISLKSKTELGSNSLKGILA